METTRTANSTNGVATRWLQTCLLVALGMVAYWPSLEAPRVFDDVLHLERNVHIRQLSPPTAWLRDPLLGCSRPLAFATFQWNFALGGLHVRSYHAVNLLIHIVAALFLLGIVQRTLRLCGVGDERDESNAPGRHPLAGWSRSQADWFAFLLAAAWMLHPLQTQAVSYIIQRCESLMGLFYLATLYGLIRGATATNRVVKRAWLLASLVAAFLSASTKEVAVTLPILCVLYDSIYLTGDGRQTLRRRWPYYVLLAGIWGWQAFLLRNAALVAPSQTINWTAFQYFCSQPNALFLYARLTFWPDLLAIDRGMAPAQHFWDFAPAGIFVLAALAATVALLVHWPRLGFLPASSFLILAPTSTIVPINDIAFEHRMYLSLVGILGLMLLLAAWGIDRLAHRFPTRAVTLVHLGRVLAVVLLLALGTRTWYRNHDYLSEETLWRQSLLANPGYPRAYSNLAALLLAQDRPEEALPYVQQALRLERNYPDARNTLAKTLARLGRIDEAITITKRTVEKYPNMSTAYHTLAELHEQREEFSQAVIAYARAIQAYPLALPSRNNLAYLLATNAQVRDPEKALLLAEENLRIAGGEDDGTLTDTLAEALYAAGRLAEAQSAWQTAERLARNAGLPDLADNIARRRAETE